MGLGQKLKSSPAGGQQSLCLGVPFLVYFNVYREGEVGPLDRGVDPEESCSKSSFFITLLKNVGDYWSFFVGLFVILLCLV